MAVRLDGEVEARRIWEQGEAEERAGRAALARAACSPASFFASR
ncbi:hypothetical protein OHJ16_10810 [Actinomyces israelii]|uniref:Uncharacterized protein n=1 Tax=Actinomyces israelii TaxID=1659 RepID=A0ABT4I9V7_9ACTO|nr:hypothetical protein [Actinomyces israelii]MCZ0858533.1 hypothetical protein [Actinomyces israelii]